MSRGPATFRQRDVEAAIRAARAAGCAIARVEVGKDGRIVLVLATDEGEATAAQCGNEWDALLK